MTSLQKAMISSQYFKDSEKEGIAKEQKRKFPILFLKQEKKRFLQTNEKSKIKQMNLS